MPSAFRGNAADWLDYVDQSVRPSGRHGLRQSDVEDATTLTQRQHDVEHPQVGPGKGNLSQGREKGPARGYMSEADTRWQLPGRGCPQAAGGFTLPPADARLTWQEGHGLLGLSDGYVCPGGGSSVSSRQAVTRLRSLACPTCPSLFR